LAALRAYPSSDQTGTARLRPSRSHNAISTPENVCAACNRSMLSWATNAAIRAMSAGLSSRWPSTDAATGRHTPWDIGQTKAAMDGSGAASHSPQPVTPSSATTRTSNASWLPSASVVISGMAK